MKRQLWFGAGLSALAFGLFLSREEPRTEQVVTEKIVIADATAVTQLRELDAKLARLQAEIDKKKETPPIVAPEAPAAVAPTPTPENIARENERVLAEFRKGDHGVPELVGKAEASLRKVKTLIDANAATVSEPTCHRGGCSSRISFTSEEALARDGADVMRIVQNQWDGPIALLSPEPDANGTVSSELLFYAN